jgi:YfiH family protein
MDLRGTKVATKVAKKKSAARKRPTAKRQRKPGANWKLHRTGGLQILESSALARLNWIVHGFSTRPGGTSELKTLENGRNVSEDVLNLGFTDWDVRQRVLENRDKFFRGVGAAKMRVVALRQIHSDLVHIVDSVNDAHMAAMSHEAAPQADALITRERGVLLVVQTADCVPILLADTKRRAVAAIHSGWRGTVKRIAEKALGRMQMEFGTNPADVIAAVGPGIGQSCYEVGTEVAAEFQAQFPNARDWFKGPFESLSDSDNDPNWLPWLTMKPPGHAPPPPRVHLDLIAANRAILAAAGIPAVKIHASGFCTACRSDLFFSYRKEHTTGRLMAAIGIR